MNTLTISQIFSNFSYYQENYLSILADQSQYQIPVEEAYVDVWPLGHRQLSLGDLLQLWFSQKWLIDVPCRLRQEHKDGGCKTPLHRQQDLYLYQLAGSALSGSNRSKVWSLSEQKVLSVELDSALKYYCFQKGSNRINLSDTQLIRALHSAI
ncbi:hypothetical protein B9T33_03275 [Acinetobacter sp. ANC 5054]|uniref:hypothetical protein n=1 Tax=Acinetobacter sp. ANC 5054 TaxID=1977877 RepID=UPI000A359C6F|nr:hypothetical protein [Acinetobacter sp. ANC 5054]OTG83436.1 hypothetical protein B9T33_03275 [Acinetobacter sp. ANC 5054]